MVQVFATMEALLTAISLSHPAPAEQLLRIVVTACLMHGFTGAGHAYLMRPVSCCQIGEAVKNQLPDMQVQERPAAILEGCRLACPPVLPHIVTLPRNLVSFCNV